MLSNKKLLPAPDALATMISRLILNTRKTGNLRQLQTSAVSCRQENKSHLCRAADSQAAMPCGNIQAAAVAVNRLVLFWQGPSSRYTCQTNRKTWLAVYVRTPVSRKSRALGLRGGLRGVDGFGRELPPQRIIRRNPEDSPCLVPTLGCYITTANWPSR